jgi:hypothetical protein
MFCDSGTFDSATAIDIKDVLIDEIAAAGSLDQNQPNAVDRQRYSKHDVHYH